MLKHFLEKTEFSSYEDFITGYKLKYPVDFNFATHVVDAWAKKEPGKLALLWCDDRGQQRSFSFKDISDLSKKAARYITSLGIKKGDMVMLFLKRSWEYWVTAVALHRIGAVLIPMSFQLTSKDIIYRAEKSKAKMLIATQDERMLAEIEKARPHCPALEFFVFTGEREGWLNFSKGMETAKPDYTSDKTITADDLMLMYFTSGTTGMPKPVCHNFKYPLGHIVTARYWQQVTEDGLHLTAADSGWAKFGWGQIYAQWLVGTAILGYYPDNNFSAHKFIYIIKKYKPTTFCVPGTIYRLMMREGLAKEDFASVKYCCTAGEPVAAEIIQDFKTVTGLEIHEGFGQSETSVLLANFPWFKPKYGSTGKFCPVYDFAILNADGKEAERGFIGELVIKNLDKYYPETLLVGYWQDNKLVPCYDKNYIYRTGDLVWQDEDGHIWFVGRNDDIIKCSGYRIGPFEIESVLNTHPAVYESAITGAPDEIRGQVVKATVVLNKGYIPSPGLTKELQDYVKKMTAPYKYPRIVEYVDALPKTTSGKIQRAEIRKAAK